VLKDERQRRILDLLRDEGRLIAADLPGRLRVSGHTVRRVLEELAEAGALRRVHGGAVPRSPVAATYAQRAEQSVPGKQAVARAAASLLRPGEVAILDGGTTALALAELLPRATVVTHSPLVAAALARGERFEVVLLGGTVDPGPMVAVGAETIRSYQRITADVCFLGIWSLHQDAGITGRYREEAEVRRVMVERADRVVGLATRDKLATVSAFASAPATALTHLAVEPGTPEEQLAPFREGGPVLIYVGRYTEVKRIPLLIRAHARARNRFMRPAPLVLLGGFPGEWEGEHPLAVVRETGNPDVFLAGWRGHEDLPLGLNAADLLVLPSVREQFGAVIVEAMACGLPALAVNAYGPAEIVDAGETGWLVPPDDEGAMADALVDAVNGDAERRRRGERAYEVARGRYSWLALARGLGLVYREVAERRPPSAGARTLTLP
jgi:DeoR/GlpR family transcriptional regulator of sugar metabolism